VLERVDLAFSRDEPAGRYVQHVLRDEAGAVRRWVAEGAAIYVCGARVGMAEEVHDALADVLGGPAFEALAAAGRYRRDVY
jgi:sulfite reductase (NADPH) flavoprotein alpha-component